MISSAFYSPAHSERSAGDFVCEADRNPLSHLGAGQYPQDPAVVDGCPTEFFALDPAPEPAGTPKPAGKCEP